MHATVVIRDHLYCWGGKQKGLQMVHESINKRQFTESVDVLDIPTFKWEKKLTKGAPPAGVRKYACAEIGNSIFYYGGNCIPDDCFHNNLFELNTLSHNWREIICNKADNRPMKKIACGMMSFKSNEQEHLLLLGGLGITPAITQTDSQYIRSPESERDDYSYTNETHVMSVSASTGIIHYYLISDFHIILYFFR